MKWLIKYCDEYYKVYTDVTKCEQFGELCTPIARTYFSSDLDKANAKLIAAAPEMLALLENITKEQPFYEFETNVEYAREFVRKFKNE